MHFKLFACKCLHYPDRREHLFHHRSNLAFLLAHFAGGLLDAARITKHHRKEDGNDRECDQRELPIEIKHHRNHADERHHVNEYAEQAVHDEALDVLDVIGYTADQVASALLVVECQRKALYMRINGEPQIIAHPLGDAGGQELLAVGADCPDQRDHDDAGDREIQGRVRIGRKQRDDRFDCGGVEEDRCAHVHLVPAKRRAHAALYGVIGT